MASVMFVGNLFINRNSWYKREERINMETDGPALREIWRDADKQCYQRYIDECDDSGRSHVYVLLHEKVNECRTRMRCDNTKNAMEDCNFKILSLAKICHRESSGVDTTPA
eukprot:GEMP01056236.1.p1 GENE.GEMP01056236.1~~GEMP01056236.1.p1  ORF type:complete len:111 (+),score=12.95 GEMP01056236.1:111-443(+)